MSPRTTHNFRLLVAGGVALFAVMPMTGCRGDRSDKPPRQFIPDMDDQPRWNPQSESAFYADGRTLRQPPEHTVPFGVSYVLSTEPWAEPWNTKRDEFLGDALSPEIYAGMDETGDFITTIPIPVTTDFIRMGQTKYNIFCATCHGINGEGSFASQDPNLGSMVGRRWSGAIPGFDDPRFLAGGERGQDGYLFTVARDGVGVKPNLTMQGYAYALDIRETWAVVAYIRALQQSHLGTLADVPEAQRAALGAPPPQPEPEPTEDQQ